MISIKFAGLSPARRKMLEWAQIKPEDFRRDVSTIMAGWIVNNTADMENAVDVALNLYFEMIWEADIDLEMDTELQKLNRSTIGDPPYWETPRD